MRYMYFQDLERNLINLHYMVRAQVTEDKAIEDAGASENVSVSLFPTEDRILEDLILDTALRLRLLDDKFYSAGKEPNLKYESVGTVKCSGDSKQINQREAENKLIHAVEFEINEQKFIGKGSYRGSKWTVTIDLSQYCINGLCKTTQYEDDWELSSKS